MTYQMMVDRNKRLGLSELFLAVGATPTGDDNSTILDAFVQSAGNIRSIATVKPDVSEGMLDLLQGGGVVGVRYVWVEYLKAKGEFTDPIDVIKLAKTSRRSQFNF